LFNRPSSRSQKPHQPEKRCSPRKATRPRNHRSHKQSVLAPALPPPKRTRRHSHACSLGQACADPRLPNCRTPAAASLSRPPPTHRRRAAQKPLEPKFMLGLDAQRPEVVPSHSRFTSSWMKRTPPLSLAEVSSQPKKLLGKLGVRGGGSEGRGGWMDQGWWAGCGRLSLPHAITAGLNRRHQLADSTTPHPRRAAVDSAPHPPASAVGHGAGARQVGAAGGQALLVVELLVGGRLGQEVGGLVCWRRRVVGWVGR